MDDIERFLGTDREQQPYASLKLALSKYFDSAPDRTGLARPSSSKQDSDGPPLTIHGRIEIGRCLNAVGATEGSDARRKLQAYATTSDNATELYRAVGETLRRELHQLLREKGLCETVKQKRDRCAAAVERKRFTCLYTGQPFYGLVLKDDNDDGSSST